MKFTKNKYISGFTLIEILVVIGIFSLIFSIGMFTSFRSYNRYVFNGEKETILAALHRARSLSMNSIDNESHGVYISPENYIIFSGDTYREDDPKNIFIKKNSAVQTSGVNEVIFHALSGESNVTGLIMLTRDTETDSISIENEGKIVW